MHTPPEPGEQLPAEGTAQSAPDEAAQSAKTAAHTRRAFLFKISLFLNGAVGAVLAVPIIGYILGPAFKKTSNYNSWVTLGAISDFPEGETRLAEFRNVTSPSDGETAKVPCWVSRIEGSKFQVFAINCAHLGCPVRWFAESRLFLCPCHGGAYYADGSRASGPPDRGLFEYKYRVSGGKLMIYAGEMPTLATKACAEKPLIQINPAEPASESGTAAGQTERSSSWPV